MIPLLTYRKISYHTIASQLLAQDHGEAALIDTTGSFSPVRLRDVLAYRLQARHERTGHKHSGYVYEKSIAKGDRGTFIDEATSMLDRVKVMRVFDLAGVVEAVSEIGEMIEASSAEQRKDSVEEDSAKKKRYKVGDSEEESDDEMLDDQPLRNDQAVEPGSIEGSGIHDGSIDMIIIDTITNVASSMVSKSPVQGQALLASLMRSLHHLTSHRQMCTILMNSVVGLNPSTNPEYHRRADDNASMFTSILGKPALGKVFTYLVDTSVLLSAMPKTRDDAATGYGDTAEDRTWQKALVLEVLKDRFGAREGRWIVFEIAAGVKLVPCFN